MFRLEIARETVLRHVIPNVVRIVVLIVGMHVRVTALVDVWVAVAQVVQVAVAMVVVQRVLLTALRPAVLVLA